MYRRVKSVDLKIVKGSGMNRFQEVTVYETSEATTKEIKLKLNERLEQFYQVLLFSLMIVLPALIYF